MTNIVALKAVNPHRWANMHMRAARIPAFSMAQRCGPALNRVVRVSPRALKKTGRQRVPWRFIAVAFERDAIT
jgi:hypothetical protein